MTINKIVPNPCFKNAISTNYNYGKNIRDNYQDKMNEVWNYSSSLYEDVLVQDGIGLTTYTKISARIVQVFEAKLQDKRGDDWKKFLFKDCTIDYPYGLFFQWSGSYWIVYNKENLSSPTNGEICRRCSTVLRKIDEWGVVHEYPTVVGTPKEVSDYTTIQQTQPAGFLPFWTQQDSYSRTWQPNDRFLVGNSGHWTVYKIAAGGISNYENEQTFDNDTAGIIRFTMMAYYENNNMDNLELGIPDYYSNLWSMELDCYSIEQVIGYTKKVNYTLYKGGNLVTNLGTVTWVSNDPTIASVTQDGTIACLSAGTTTITCTMNENSDVLKSVNVTVVEGTPVQEETADVLPIGVDEVQQGVSTTFTVKYYVNSVDTVIENINITLNPNGVPVTNYQFNTSSNTFTIKNVKKFFNAPLIINISVEGIEIQKKIYLVGNL